MRAPFPALVLATALLAAGCGGNGDPRAETGPAPEPTTTADRAPAPPPAPVFGRGRVVIRTDGEGVDVAVEIAETPEQRQFGLMFRKFVADDAGMVFLFPQEETGGFWMKNTLIPLSIAYYDRTGKIVRILDMEPCRADPCPVYEPGVAYRGALEVNKGAFRRWGVAEGDTIELERR